MPPAARALRLAAGCLLTAALVVAPLNFGSTRSNGAEVIAFTLTAATLLWAASLISASLASYVPSSHLRPRFGHWSLVIGHWSLSLSLPPLVAVAAATFIVAALPWITGLATPTVAAPFTTEHFARITARWPVSILATATFSPPLFLVTVVAALLPLTDLARHPRWALTFALALIVPAVFVALLALAQNHTAAPGIYWRNDGRMPGDFTGTFFHHTSFGAFLNTAWPLAAALAWLTRSRHPLLAALAAGTCLLLLATHTAHIGRFPQLVALLLAPVLFLALRPVRRFPRHPRLWIFLAAALAALPLLFILGGRGDTIFARWQLLVNPVTIPFISPPESAWPGLMRDDLVIAGTSHPGWFGDRRVGWRTALSAIVARPFNGHGPGNWQNAASQHTADPFVRTFYQFLQFTHHDPLQHTVEWGLPAALALWTLLLAPIVTVLRHRRTAPPLALAAATALTAILLQAQLDFPLQIPALALITAALTALAWTALPPPSVIGHWSLGIGHSSHPTSL